MAINNASLAGIEITTGSVAIRLDALEPIQSPGRSLPSPAPLSSSRRRDRSSSAGTQTGSTSSPVINNFQFAAFAGDGMGCQMTILMPSNPVPVLDAALQPNDGPVWLPHNRSNHRVHGYSINWKKSRPSLNRIQPFVCAGNCGVAGSLQQAMQAPKDLTRNLDRRDSERSESNVVVLDTSFGSWDTVWDHMVNPQFRLSQ